MMANFKFLAAALGTWILLSAYRAAYLCPIVTYNDPGNTFGPIDTAANQYFLFSYFIGQDKGMCYALSTDGLSWVPLNNGKPYLVPEVGSQKLMRDPSINVGPDSIYRVVWTTGWKGIDIGYAFSSDLIHWSAQRSIPVMKGMKRTRNCWAPEIFYDDIKKQYMIYWSSAVGAWSIYYVTTKDFEQFTAPQILFSNGFKGGGKAKDQGVIDAYLFEDTPTRYILFYKKDDNSGVPNLFYRIGPSPTGPWENEIGPMMPSTGDEGPSCVKVGQEYRVYTDPSESDKAYVFVSGDLQKWQRKTTDLKMSHGSVIKITRSTALRLLDRR